jgi:hypothetical protein
MWPGMAGRAASDEERTPMCDDRPVSGPLQETSSGLSRRGFLHGAGAAAAAVALLKRFPRLPLHSADRAVTADGTSAYSMAMHVHSSFSEYDGSMASQLFQAAANAVDVVWWTDHDQRMDGLGYRRVVHFTSLTDERGGPGQGGTWIWQKVESGPLTAGSGGGIVGQPCSPNDPVSGGSMHLTARSRTTAPAKSGYYANSHPSRYNYRDNLTGQSLSIDVLLSGGWTAGYLELLITSSYHRAMAGRPAGDYTLSYRCVPPGGRASRVANGIDGVITIPVKPGGGHNSWDTVTVTPSEDIAALWPDLDYRDFALFELTLSAVSEGDPVDGYFDYLRFDRQISGEAFLTQQQEMEAVLAPQFPSVTQQQGLEVSWELPHVNWFGGGVVIPDYGNTTANTWNKYLRETLVPQAHAAGGLVSYNHPYGYGYGPKLSTGRQDALLTSVARQLLGTAALGTDLIEVGYPLRQGVDLAHHVALWDIMSRNGVFLTGNGTNDDHYGQDWLGIRDNWFSSVWAKGTAQGDLLAALAAGRAWCGSLSRYRGSLDLLVDGSVPMGSVSVSKVATRQLAAAATGVPRQGVLQVLQGLVDYAGTAGLASNAEVIGAYTAAELAGGPARQPVDNHADSFVRTQVLDASGTVIGLSNPVWLLRKSPPGGIPGPRAA